MAKTQKYSEDQLLEAVIRFAEIEKKKIKATELAKWCRDNIEGLEEVRDYHFTRPVKEKDEKTGKIVECPKLCTVRMDEINKSRSLTVSVNTNLLLRASNIDTFMEQPTSSQRKMIVETRETVDKLLTKNTNLTRENEALRTENKSLKKDILSVSDKVDILKKTQEKLIKQVTYLMKKTDEEARKKMLSEMGIEDASIDLDVYTQSLQQNIDDVMDINKVLKNYIVTNTSNLDENVDINATSLNDKIMSGLDF
ncbi:hypothetical protein Cpap_1237 [Ruminiclostridium papyrosolvens DSM 2782]|uniref:Uncharacterized protein n=1 Tax=Ruminiclostridium papyrosolvens DSM 2782 TaxID=588581 RepID=F1TFA3_9FIRM|nr:hypothetical protein [Ruminiclostridium papyrosolvens]EGD47041.1 hypothetical protein Cpap_1237 [Ruminiclostridium papyrosolvens DSM 2782]WES33710.1 hypothetical protein P0092_18375 [Ruminiclostridium papyrosolvens DSM 2782]